jgi:hypothetical protein
MVIGMDKGTYQVLFEAGKDRTGNDGLVQVPLENVFDVPGLTQLLSSNQREFRPLVRIQNVCTGPVLLLVDPFPSFLVRVLIIK